MTAERAAERQCACRRHLRAACVLHRPRRGVAVDSDRGSVRGGLRRFTAEVRRIIYTTNAIESLNSTLRTAIRSRGHFPNDEAAMKLLHLALRAVCRKWKNAQREWTAAMTQFAIMFGDRLTAE